MRLTPDVAEALARAWEISALTGDEYVAAAHDFVCHFHDDPPRCQGDHLRTCIPTKSHRDMLDLANDVREASNDLDDFIRVWSQTAPN